MFLLLLVCIHKPAAPMHQEKAHDTTYKMAVALGMKRKVMDCEFPIDCHVLSVFDGIFMGEECVV